MSPCTVDTGESLAAWGVHLPSAANCLRTSRSLLALVGALDLPLVLAGVEDFLALLRAVFVLHIAENLGALLGQRHTPSL